MGARVRNLVQPFLAIARRIDLGPEQAIPQPRYNAFSRFITRFKSLLMVVQRAPAGAAE